MLGRCAHRGKGGGEVGIEGVVVIFTRALVGRLEQDRTGAIDDAGQASQGLAGFDNRITYGIEISQVTDCSERSSVCGDAG